MRYFIVFYKGSLGESSFSGNIAVESNVFFKEGQMEEFLIDKYGFDRCIMTGFNEITENDFKEYVK